MKKIIALSLSIVFTTSVLAQQATNSDSNEQISNLLKGLKTKIEQKNSPDASKKVVIESSKPIIKAENKQMADKPTVEPSIVAKPEIKSVVVDNTLNQDKNIKPANTSEKTSAPVVSSTKEVIKNSEYCDPNPKPCEIKPVIKKQVKKVKNKAVVKKSVNSSIVKQEKESLKEDVPSVLLNSTYFHVPKNLSFDDLSKIENPITYKDLKVSFIKNEQNNLSVKFTDNRTNEPLDKFYFSSTDIDTLTVNTDLSNARFSTISYSEDITSVVELNNEDQCQAVLIKYRLKTEAEPHTTVKFFGINGELSDTIPEKCNSLNLDSKDTTFYTNGGNIINFGFNQKELAYGKLGMTLHFIKEGREFFPSSLYGVAISTDFSSMTLLNTKADSRSPYFGLTISQPIKANSYYVLFGLENDKKYEWIKSSVSVQ